MSRLSLIGLYALFAVLATLLNLGIQRLILAIEQSTIGFALAIVAGTGAGLVLKYLLDKRWIFRDPTRGARENGRKFSRYTVMGLVTTGIFWTTETAFWLVWQTDGMRELGAVLGLTLGYAVKYWLDRRFVFTDAAPARAV
ncbi:GtrA family protein [Salipiger sp. PrR002]|uniref:GtrA family protein n=1 Tax=Salipiger sp. PrR002 TaxID=2706489 RepID=UPI0034CF45C2